MRILLIRLRQIGDVVFTTPAVHALRRRFPDAHLSYVVEPAAAPPPERAVERAKISAIQNVGIE